MLRLLRWFGLRGPQARGPDRVVDMNPVILDLDDSLSSFTTMLMRLSGPKKPQTLAEQAAEVRRARVEWTDWRDCYPELSRDRPLIDWLDDELVPRFS